MRHRTRHRIIFQVSRRIFISRCDAHIRPRAPYFSNHPIDSKLTPRNVVADKNKNGDKIKLYKSERHTQRRYVRCFRTGRSRRMHTHDALRVASIVLPYSTHFPLPPPSRSASSFSSPLSFFLSRTSFSPSLFNRRRVPPTRRRGGMAICEASPSPFNIVDRGTNEYSLNTFFRF